MTEYILIQNYFFLILFVAFLACFVFLLGTLEVKYLNAQSRPKRRKHL